MLLRHGKRRKALPHHRCVPFQNLRMKHDGIQDRLDYHRSCIACLWQSLVHESKSNVLDSDDLTLALLVLHTQISFLPFKKNNHITPNPTESNPTEPHPAKPYPIVRMDNINNPAEPNLT